MRATILGVTAVFVMTTSAAFAEPDAGEAGEAGEASEASEALKVPALTIKPPGRNIQRYGYGLGVASLRLQEEWLSDPKLRPAERERSERPPTGFINLTIPDKLTPGTVAAAAGILAGKMLLIRELCGIGRCRVDTGPGDLDPGWVEFYSGVGTPASAAPAKPLRSGR